jgi:hypothetical protein
MTKLRRGGYGSGEWAYNKVLKLRVMQQTYDKLLELQDSKGVCMAYLLREFLYDGLNKEFTEK